MVGNTTVEKTDSTKLLGIFIDHEQDWSRHYKILKSALNQRLFVIRRVQRLIPKNKVMSIVHSLWVSKLRYGLQLCTRVQILTEGDKKCMKMKSLQLTQNRLLRALNGSKIKDKVSVISLLKKFNLLSVNQLAAQIKLIEVWKSLNIQDYPTTLEPYNEASSHSILDLRPRPTRIFNDTSKLMGSKYSFHVDAARLWNLAPPSLRASTTLGQAKIAILAFARSLPV